MSRFQEKPAMADKLPTPLNGGNIDANTLATIQHQAPVPSGSASPLTRTVQSPEAKAAMDAAVGNVGQLSYDAFVRKYVYEPAAQAISQQGDEFVRQNIMTSGQAAEWVNAQRNGLLLSVRDQRNTPLGRAISEYLKPRDKLPSVAELAKKFGGQKPAATREEVFEAIICSGARTRGSINKLACAFRWAGPVLLVVNVGVSAYLVAEAAPNQRGRMATREAGGLVGGFGGGWAEAGCAGGAAAGVWFEVVGAVPGCAVGAVAGGLGLGWAGSKVGSWMGERTFDWSHTFVSWATK
jgi:hypothetical protein